MFGSMKGIECLKSCSINFRSFFLSSFCSFLLSPMFSFFLPLFHSSPLSFLLSSILSFTLSFSFLSFLLSLSFFLFPSFSILSFFLYTFFFNFALLNVKNHSSQARNTCAYSKPHIDHKRTKSMAFSFQYRNTFLLSSLFFKLKISLNIFVQSRNLKELSHSCKNRFLSRFSF